MAITLFPLDNTDYTAQDMATYFSTRTNGVFSANGELSVTSNNNMTVTVASGRAWLSVSKFKGLMFFNEEPVTLDIQQADGVLSRIDRVVVRYDAVNNNGALVVKKGTLSSTPVAPSLVRNETEYYELALCDILVSKGVTSITSSVISDQRLNSDVCGVVSDGVTHIPTDVLENQFKEWFKNLQNQLDSNQASNLQNQITTFRENGGTLANGSITKSGSDFLLEAIESNNIKLKYSTAGQETALVLTHKAFRPTTGDDVSLGIPTNRFLNGYINNLTTTRIDGDSTGLNLYAGTGPAIYLRNSVMCSGTLTLPNNASLRGNSTVSQGYIDLIWSNGDYAYLGQNANGMIVATHFRPFTNGTFDLGTSTQRWRTVYASTGTIQTSDERYKSDIVDIDDTVLFNMVKGTSVNTYVLNDEMVHKSGVTPLTLEEAEQERKHLGIIAQELAKHEGSEYILNYDDEAGYSVNNYNLTCMVMGALKVEISKREQLENEVNELKALVNQLLNK